MPRDLSLDPFSVCAGGFEFAETPFAWVYDVSLQVILRAIWTDFVERLRHNP